MVLTMDLLIHLDALREKLLASPVILTKNARVLIVIWRGEINAAQPLMDKLAIMMETAQVAFALSVVEVPALETSYHNAWHHAQDAKAKNAVMIVNAGLVYPVTHGAESWALLHETYHLEQAYARDKTTPLVTRKSSIELFLVCHYMDSS